MAPSPENDNAPKAPDKSDTNKCEKQSSADSIKEKDKDEKTLSNLNDGELKALLDEAINYKNPKDREGKSKLFKDLLTQAEETERIARATSAGGSEVARHYNTSARHQRRRQPPAPHGRHQRCRRQVASVSENMVHGGSLDNLAKEEMYGESADRLVVAKSVSARQREGGSLPCDVNSASAAIRDLQFIEEAKKHNAQKKKEYTAVDIESSTETQRLLDPESLTQKYQENQEISILPRYRTNATLQISATPVDEHIPLELDSVPEKRPYDLDNLQTKVQHSKYRVFIPTYRGAEERKVDENCNALQQAAKAKKKKAQADKNVTVLPAERVEGHRGDIINDVDKLIQYIGGENATGKGGKFKQGDKSKQLHKQHASEEGPSGKKKQRAASSKGKETRPDLKKSNSLGEMPTAALEDFAFASPSSAQKDGEKVVMRQKTPGDNRPKERRSWGNVEPPPFQIPSSNASTENLETDTWVVTKPKKKSKKRRPAASDSSAKRPTSPEARGKSVPPSEKSADSSDNDSVRSLPLDAPVSYADIAKAKEKKPEICETPTTPTVTTTTVSEASKRSPPPDVRNVRSFPAIAGKGGAGEKTNARGGKGRRSSAGGGGVVVVENVVGAAAAEVAATAVVVTSSIQNDLTIIHSNEKESIQFNAQMLPPNIPDVQTIEKMHFLNHPASRSQQQPPTEPVPRKKEAAKKDPPSSKKEGSAKKESARATPKREVPPTRAEVPAPRREAPPARVVDPTPRREAPPTRVVDPAPRREAPPARVVDPASRREAPPTRAEDHTPRREAPSTRVEDHTPRREAPPTRVEDHTPRREARPARVEDHTPRRETPPAARKEGPSTRVEDHAPRRENPPARVEVATLPVPACVELPASRIEATPAEAALPTVPVAASPSKEEAAPTPEESEPPVVILSGLGSKENASGLVFGFDVNQQLLSEDICEDFIARFVMPPTSELAAINHEKIVNFIGSAWDAVINDSNGEVKYYSDNS